MDTLGPILLVTMLYKELPLSFSFGPIPFFFQQDGTIHQGVEIRVDMGNYLLS
jgi:hypothetical protein